MNSVSQSGRKAVPGDLFSGAVSPELGRILACEQYSTTQSSKIFKYYLAFSVLMDRRLRYFWLLAQPLNRKCQREIRVSDLHCSFPYKTISCEMKIMNSQVIIHSPLVKKISFIILTFLCAKIYTCYYFIFYRDSRLQTFPLR